MKSYTTAFGLAALATTVAGHGYLTTPAPREPGDAMKEACGQTIWQMFASDINGNPQGALQASQSQPGTYNADACDIWTCKGMQFDDNKDKVQSYTAGQTVAMVANIAAPHTGVANVSVVDLATGSIIGTPLKEWTGYASTETGITDDERNWDITIPSDLGSKCAEPGACALKWWWDARSIDQTYIACVDFTVGGSGSGSSPAPSSSAAASSTAASSTAASSTEAAAPSTTAATEPTATAAPTDAASPTAVDTEPSASATAAPTPAEPSSGCKTPLPEKFTVQELIAYLQN